MTSALSPRDIQSRIRSGASLDEVAQEAGVPAEKVEPYAAPVLAEREHLAGTALQCPVRRRGESSSVRSMRATVAETLLLEGVDADEVEWDAWREEDRSWTIRGSWHTDDEPTEHEALFRFDQRARFSVARNDDARHLIGEVVPGQRRQADADAEPTIDLNDELAIVRAVQGDAPLVSSEVAEQVLADQASQDETPQHDQPEQDTVQLPRPRTDELAAQPDEEPEPQPADELEDVEDYAEVELEQVDGVYDIVPSTTGEMDALYEMLASFNEDSVNIYSGLSSPVLPESRSASPAAESTESAESPESPESAESPDSPESADSPASPESAPEVDEEAEPEVVAELDADATPVDAAYPFDAEVIAEQATAVPAEPVEEIPVAAIEQAVPDEAVAELSPVPSSPVGDEDEWEPTQAIPVEAFPSDIPIPATEAEPEDLLEPTALIPRPQAAPVETAAPAEPEVDESLAPVDSELQELAVPEVDAPEAEPPAAEPTPDPEAPDLTSEVAAAAAGLEQDALIEHPDPEAKPAPKKRAKSKRASIPSWDEIMFGSPTSPKK